MWTIVDGPSAHMSQDKPLRQYSSHICPCSDCHQSLFVSFQMKIRVSILPFCQVMKVSGPNNDRLLPKRVLYRTLCQQRPVTTPGVRDPCADTRGQRRATHGEGGGPLLGGGGLLSPPPTEGAFQPRQNALSPSVGKQSFLQSNRFAINQQTRIW